MKPSRLNIRQQINDIRESEMARIAQNMNMMGGVGDVARRYAIFRRTINSPAEEQQILQFEDGNDSGAMPAGQF